MGTMVESLELGCDCLGEIVYLDDQQLRYANKDKHTRNAYLLSTRQPCTGQEWLLLGFQLAVSDLYVAVHVAGWLSPMGEVITKKNAICIHEEDAVSIKR